MVCGGVGGGGCVIISISVVLLLVSQVSHYIILHTDPPLYIYIHHNLHTFPRNPNQSRPHAHIPYTKHTSFKRNTGYKLQSVSSRFYEYGETVVVLVMVWSLGHEIDCLDHFTQSDPATKAHLAGQPSVSVTVRCA